MLPFNQTKDNHHIIAALTLLLLREVEIEHAYYTLSQRTITRALLIWRHWVRLPNGETFFFGAAEQQKRFL